MTVTGINWRFARFTRWRISGGTNWSTTDPVNQPWIDEGLAEYSSRIYYEAVHGMGAADILESRRWQFVVDGLNQPAKRTRRSINR